jgi:hypothetical protein
MTLVATVSPRPGAVALRLMAAFAVPAALAYNAPISGRLTIGMVVVFGLAPIWAPAFVKVRYGAMLLSVGVLFLVGGFLVGWASRADHAVPHGAAIGLAITYATYIGFVGALVWASQVIGIESVVISYAVVLLGGALLDRGSWLQNPWKYALAVPVALIVLAVLDHAAPNGVKILAFGALAVLCVKYDYRSGLAMFLLAAALMAWQQLRRHKVREPSIAVFLIGLIAVAGGVYYTVTRLLVSGLLGAELQARSARQVQASGTLLLGGRPEWTVTIRLFFERPWGFGFGAVPSPADYQLGRQGFASIHLSSQENYLKHYVFKGGFRLHSIVADLWVAAGPAGILLAAVILWILVATLATELAHRPSSSVRAYLTILALWNIGFSPVYTNLPQVVIALAVAMAVIARPPPRPPGFAGVGSRPADPEADPVPLPDTGVIGPQTGAMLQPVGSALKPPATGPATVAIRGLAGAPGVIRGGRR